MKEPQNEVFFRGGFAVDVCMMRAVTGLNISGAK